jgi:hypothetical protein
MDRPLMNDTESPNGTSQLPAKASAEYTELKPTGAGSKSIPGDVSAPTRRATMFREHFDKQKLREDRRSRSPLLMLTCFVVGLCGSIAHCVFYPKLDGVVVEDSADQERNIRQETFVSSLDGANGCS